MFTDYSTPWSMPMSGADADAGVAVVSLVPDEVDDGGGVDGAALSSSSLRPLFFPARRGVEGGRGERRGSPIGRRVARERVPLDGPGGGANSYPRRKPPHSRGSRASTLRWILTCRRDVLDEFDSTIVYPLPARFVVSRLTSWSTSDTGQHRESFFRRAMARPRRPPRSEPFGRSTVAGSTIFQDPLARSFVRSQYRLIEPRLCRADACGLADSGREAVRRSRTLADGTPDVLAPETERVNATVHRVVILSRAITPRVRLIP